MATEFSVTGSRTSAPSDVLGTFYSELRERIGHYAGYGRSGWDSDQTDNINDALKDGLRWFYTPQLVESRFSYQWSFLRPMFTITTTAPYDTGTIAIASGVVTLTGGTFPAGAASGELKEESNGNTYTVSTRDSDTQLTLDDTSVNVDAGTTYWLGFPEVDLPSDFASLESRRLTYDPGVSDYYPPIEIVRESIIAEHRMKYDEPDKPQIAAVRVKSHDYTVGTRYKLALCPVADAAYRLTGRYRINPDMIDSTNKYPPGADVHVQTIIASCLAAYERNCCDGEGRWQEEFPKLLAASIAQDSEAVASRRLGRGSDGGEGYPGEPTHCLDGIAPSYDNDPC